MKRNLMECITKLRKVGTLNNYQPIRWRDDTDNSHLRSECWATSANIFSSHTVDTFSICGLNFCM